MFCLDFVKTCILLPDPQGSCDLFPKVNDQLTELDDRKKRDGEIFPGSAMSFTSAERCKWMKEIHDNRPIGQIIWPGTRNSATNMIGIQFLTRPFGQHQQQSIYHQLLHGVRALDIRVRQDRLVCNGYMLSYSIDVVIRDIKRFLDETETEIIILEIRTERGYTDPLDFDKFLVEQLGDRLIHQDDEVFWKTISQVLPKRIICVWKPNHSPRPKVGGPLWNTNYMKDDEFDIEMPLTKIDGNLSNLQEQGPASERLFFYKVEHTLSTQSRINPMHCLLIWPMISKVMSKRISGFSRLFLATCHSRGVLDGLQIYSTDFVDDDFVNACISLNRTMRIVVQEKSEDTSLGETTDEEKSEDTPLGETTDEDEDENSKWLAWLGSWGFEIVAELYRVQEGTELTDDQISKSKEWFKGDKADFESSMRSIGVNVTAYEFGELLRIKVREKLTAALTSHQDQSSSFISAAQLRLAMIDIDINMFAEDYIEDYIREWGVDNDGQISCEEFIEHFMTKFNFEE